jgi:hypothetical protein
VKPSAELASPSSDKTDANGAANYAEVGRRTILRTKLDAQMAAIGAALDCDDRRAAVALAEELRAVLLALTPDDVKQPTLWQRLMMDDDP